MQSFQGPFVNAMETTHCTSSIKYQYQMLFHVSSEVGFFKTVHVILSVILFVLDLMVF